MTDREFGSGALARDFLKTAGIVAGAAALAFAPAALVLNGIASTAEFNGVQSQIMTLVEQGKLKGPDGTPKPHIVKYKGQEFAINVISALRTQNGQFRDAGGQVVQDSQTQAGDGATRSQVYSSGYEINGVMNRIKGSESWLRPFFNDGGQRAFTVTWTGAKPGNAPLSTQPTLGAQPVTIAPANPGALPPQQPAPAAPAPAGPTG